MEMKLTKNFQVYVTLLASIPTISQSLRTSINQNLNDSVELHEELLGNLHRVVPHSEYSQATYPRLPTVAVERGHRRFRSLEMVPGDPLDLSTLQKVPGMSAEASVAAGVAIVFGQKVKFNRLNFFERSSNPRNLLTWKGKDASLFRV